MGAKLEFDNTGIASIVSEKSRNELDDIVFASIIDRDLTAPPSADPTNGDRYIPKATATLDWKSKEDSIMFWHGYWAEIKPTQNMRAWLEDEKIWIEYSGSAWVNVPLPLLNVESKGANYTILTPADNGKLFTNSAAITITLPAATVGQHYFFAVGSANNLTIAVQTGDKTSLPATGILGSADKGIIAGAIGESIHLVCTVATTWQAFGGQTPTGIWVAEA